MEKNAILKDVKLWHLKILNLQVTGLLPGQWPAAEAEHAQVCKHHGQTDLGEVEPLRGSHFCQPLCFQSQRKLPAAKQHFVTWLKSNVVEMRKACNASHVPLERCLSESKQILIHPTVIGSTKDATFNYSLLMDYFIIQ